MRCVCCDKNLTDYEATRRHMITKEFLDMCGECLSAVSKEANLPYRDRPELWSEYDMQEDDEPDDYPVEQWGVDRY